MKAGGKCSVIQKEVLSARTQIALKEKYTLSTPNNTETQAENEHKGGNDFKREDILCVLRSYW